MNSSLRIVRSYYPKVTKIVDAKGPRTVSIARNDIRAARRLDHNGCAMVEACKRIKDHDGAVVSKRTAYLVRGDTAERYEVPERILREITSFDRGAAFIPGEYTLYQPHHKKKRKDKRANHDTNPGGGKKVKLVMHNLEGVRPSMRSIAPKKKK